MRISIELGCFGFQIADAVFEGRSAPAEIDCRIPIAAVRHRYPRRKHFEVPPVIVVRPAALEVLKVCVAHHSHIALMRALNDDDITGVKVFSGMNKSHGRPSYNEGGRP
jgi:hypothetical protein